MSDRLPRGRSRTRLRYRRGENGHGIRHLPGIARTAGRRVEKSGGTTSEKHLEAERIMATVTKSKKRTVRINGCVASAQAAKYADVDVIAAYPIRPYTATMMALAQMVAV